MSSLPNRFYNELDDNAMIYDVTDDAIAKAREIYKCTIESIEVAVDGTILKPSWNKVHQNINATFARMHDCRNAKIPFV